MKLNIWKQMTGAAPGVLDSIGALLAGRELAPAQSAEHLEMIPILGAPLAEGQFAPPNDALALERVAKYGTMILENKEDRPAIVPLQLGYLQKGAQNHAMCTAGVLAPKSKHTFSDACCIQQAQGGLMSAHDERFIVLPHPLRAEAFALRGQESFQKLWNPIAKLNAMLGLKARGHLDELKHERQPELVRILHQLEPVEGQTGAVFSFNGRFVGLELAPDPTFWSQLHSAIVMYCYAPLTLIPAFVATDESWKTKLDDTGVDSMNELVRRLAALADRRKQRAVERVTRLAATAIKSAGESRTGPATLLSIAGAELAGQAVFYGEAPAYASVFSTTAFAAKS